MDGYYRTKVIQRLKSSMKTNGKGCYIWTGTVTPRGYGTTHFEGKIRLVHRLSIMLFKDLELDTEFTAKRTCKERLCFNPDHYLVKIK